MANDSSYKLQYDTLMAGKPLPSWGSTRTELNEQEQAYRMILNGYYVQNDIRKKAQEEKRPFETVAMEAAIWLYKNDKTYFNCLVKNGWTKESDATGKAACRFQADSGQDAQIYMTQQERDAASQDFLNSLQQQMGASAINIMPIVKGVGIFGLVAMLVGAVIMFIKNK